MLGDAPFCLALSFNTEEASEAGLLAVVLPSAPAIVGVWPSDVPAKGSHDNSMPLLKTTLSKQILLDFAIMHSRNA